MNLLEIWAPIGPVIGLAAGWYLPHPKKTIPVAPLPVSAPRYIPEHPAPAMRHTPLGERDEFLRWDGDGFSPLDPPEYVPDGRNPVRACQERARQECVSYDSRRVTD